MDEHAFTSRLASFRELFIAHGHVVTGCTQAQIEAIERDHGIALPQFYQIYLRFFGVECGDYLKGSCAFYKDLSGPDNVT